MLPPPAKVFFAWVIIMLESENWSYGSSDKSSVSCTLILVYVMFEGSRRHYRSQSTSSRGDCQRGGYSSVLIASYIVFVHSTWIWKCKIMWSCYFLLNVGFIWIIEFKTMSKNLENDDIVIIWSRYILIFSSEDGRKLIIRWIPCNYVWPKIITLVHMHYVHLFLLMVYGRYRCTITCISFRFFS